MPRQIVRLLLAVLILASLFGGRSLVANVTDEPQHVVKPGETLSEIAAQYGLTVEQIVSLNGLNDPDRVTEGRTLKLPAGLTQTPTGPAGAPAVAASSSGGPAPSAGAQASAPAAPQPEARTTATSEYVVQPGDTLSGIAKALGVTQKSLLEANELADPNRLIAGRKLLVPAGATPPSPVVPAARSNQPGSTASGSNAPTSAPGAGSTTVAGPPSAATAPSTSPSAGSANVASPVAADETSAALDRLAQQYGVDPALIRALAWIESNGKPYRPESTGGVGHLTLTDKTFEYVQASMVKRTLDRENVADNLEAAVAYAAAMLKWGGDDSRGLAAFLQGPGSVRTNGVRPAIEEQVKRILALRDRITTEAPATTAAVGAGPGRAASSGAAPAAAPVAESKPSAPPTSAAPLVPAEPTASLMARAVGAARTVAGPDARIGVSARNMVSGQRFAVLGDQSFPAASVAKLALLVEVYRQSFGGAIVLTEPQRADLRAMIVSSDNDAANRLMEVLTTRSVNANLYALGLVGTRLVNSFGLTTATGNPANVSTPDDMTRLLELIATEQLVSPQASREMRALLLQSQDGSKLRRGLPPEARLAHKSGWYDGVANDVGIVTHEQGSYIVSVFTEGIPDDETANQTIAAISQTLYGAWGPKDADGNVNMATRPAR